MLYSLCLFLAMTRMKVFSRADFFGILTNHTWPHVEGFYYLNILVFSIVSDMKTQWHGKQCKVSQIGEEDSLVESEEGHDNLLVTSQEDNNNKF